MLKQNTMPWLTHGQAGGPWKAGRKSPGDLTSCRASLLLRGLLMLSWESPFYLWFITLRS